jgi:hypothetical protein
MSCGYILPRHGASSGYGWMIWHPIWRIAAIILSSHGQPTRGSPAWGLGKDLTTPHPKRQLVTKCFTGPRTGGSCENGNELSPSLKGREFPDKLS